MPEYRTPGMYIEETSLRSKSIEGVSTTTTGFVGPTRYGPVDLKPDIITSLSEFERVYGDRRQLNFEDTGEMHNYMWHAVRVFFEEGGKRLYISRVFNPVGPDNDGCAHDLIPADPNAVAEKRTGIKIRARFPGKFGEMRVRLSLRLGRNILGSERVPNPSQRETFIDEPTVKSLSDGDVVWISKVSGSPTVSPIEEYGAFYIARSHLDATTKEITWRFEKAFDGTSSTPQHIELFSPPDQATPISHLNPNYCNKVCVVTLTVSIMRKGESDLPPLVYEGIPLHSGHKRGGEPDSLFDRFAAKPGLSLERVLPIVIEKESIDLDGVDVLNLLFVAKSTLRKSLFNDDAIDTDRSIDLILKNGNDGQRPLASDYEGTGANDRKNGLKSFEDIEEISIVAAPGSTFEYENGYGSEGAAIINNLISHSERMRYRIAVLDSGNSQTISQVRAMRAKFESAYAALYYPWVSVLDPVTNQDIRLPPSGFVAGIYVRNDIERGVYKAPANEVVRTAIGFETTLSKSQQEVLNPEGVNCFRFFEGRGYRLWGARTISSDPEWKYVNLRRYFAYLEKSIEKGTQSAVFEPNGQVLWTNVKRNIEDFLFREYQIGALLGDKPEKAYFVKCDRSTMTQNDLDNGRLVCLIGVAPLRPSEFVIFRIGQWTSDRKS